MFEIGSSAGLAISVALATAIGFAFSGIAASSYALFTNQRLKFESARYGGVAIWPRVALLFISGPYILLRNSLKAAMRGLRPRFWLVLSALVASGWSFCTGLVILNVMGLLRNAGF